MKITKNQERRLVLVLLEFSRIMSFIAITFYRYTFVNNIKKPTKDTIRTRDKDLIFKNLLG